MAAARVASGAATPIMSGAALASLVRRNWLLAILLVAGLVLRAAAQLAYRPALLFIDSIKYLFGAYAGNDPPGYELVLKVSSGSARCPWWWPSSTCSAWPWPWRST